MHVIHEINVLWLLDHAHLLLKSLLKMMYTKRNIKLKEIFIHVRQPVV